MKKTSIAAMLAAATLLFLTACGKKSATNGFVDLNLPSGLLWASCNLGADTPEGFGDYYAWGETSPKKVYDEDSYQLDTAKYGKSTGKMELDASDDVATKKLGKGYRIPTADDWQELLSHTTIVQTTVNDIPGYTFVGSNGNTIFLPAAGIRNGSNLEYYKRGDENGFYWSSTFSKVPDHYMQVERDEDGNDLCDEDGNLIYVDVLFYSPGALCFSGNLFVNNSEDEEDYIPLYLDDRRGDFLRELFYGLSVRPVYDWTK